MQPPQPMQQPDIQMLQRQIMFKQLQEMQRKQQLHEYGDPRQQNYINQLSFLNKQGYGGQIPSLIRGQEIIDASQVVSSAGQRVVQHGASPVIQGFSHGLVFSQAQSHALSSVGVEPRQLAGSLYGTPVTLSDNLNQYSHNQGASHSFSNIMTRGNNNPMEISIIQSTDINNSFGNQNCSPSFNQGYMPSGASGPKQVFEDKKKLYGEIPQQGSCVLPGKLQQLNNLQAVGAMQESGRRLEQAGWPPWAPVITPESGASRGMPSLDPLEEKILFNTDYHSWGAPLGQQNHMGAVGFEREAHADCDGLFPSMQSGSWSALMQSAVAEASSGDTGAQEEWSGLSFQNPEALTDNQPSNYIESGKQQSNWVKNSLENVGSPSSNMHVNSGFTGFGQSNGRTLKQRDALFSDSSPESVQQSPRKAHKRSDNPHLNCIEENHLIQVPSEMQNNWLMPHHEHSGSDAQNWSISLSGNIGEACNSQTGYEQRGKVGLSGPAAWPSPLGNDEQSNLLAKALSSYGQVYPERIMSVNNDSCTGVDSEKGFLLESNASEGVQHQSSVVSNSVLFESSAGLDSPLATAQSREKMLDLLNKDDESIENGSGMQLGSVDTIPRLEVPQPENFDASVTHSFKRISHLQGFGAPLSCHSHKLRQVYSSSLPFEENSSATSGPLYLCSQLQSQDLLDAPRPGRSPHAGLDSDRYPQSGSTSKDLSNLPYLNPHGHELPVPKAMPFVQPSVLRGASQQSIKPNLSSPTPMQPSLPHSAPHGALSNSLPSPDSASSSLQNSARTSHYHHNQSSTNDGNDLHMYDACYGKSQDFDRKEELSGKEGSSLPTVRNNIFNAVAESRAFSPGQDVAKHVSNINSSTSNSVMTSMHQGTFSSAPHTDGVDQSVSAVELEVFGRSLRPSHGPHQNYSLLQHVHSLKNMEMVPSCMLSEIDNKSKLASRVPGNSNLNLLSQLNTSTSGDNKHLSCSYESEGDQTAKALPCSSSQGTSQMVMFGLNNSDTRSSHSSAASNTLEQARIIAQMPHSWFKHYGTLQNGQMLQKYDSNNAKDVVHRTSASKSFQNLHTNSSTFQGNSSDASQGSSICPTMAVPSKPSKQLHPLHMIQPNLEVLRPKKRKTRDLNLLAWHKEITTGPQRLQSISMAESKWASATKRIKVKLDDAEVIDYGIPMPGAKRRLVLTTQLMQQVFQPAPSAIIFAGASSHYESILYFAARLTLGDACGVNRDSYVAFDSSNLPSEKLDSPESIRQPNFSKRLEDFIKQAKSLEDVFSRMERRNHFLDVRVESQELEKFYIMNRLAKFHSRVHVPATDTSSSSGSSPAITKSFPQRYVVALPMPRTVPQISNCLSL